MLGRILRFAPLAAAGWRMWQNHQRKKNAQTGRDGLDGTQQGHGQRDRRR